MLNRRQFLSHTGKALLAPSLVSLSACADRLASDSTGLPEAGPGSGGYGSLHQSPEVPELLIPTGFTCIKLSETLTPSRADPTFIVPQALDGMSSHILPNGNIRLIRNHELRDTSAAARPLASPEVCYDPRAGGGTTSLELRVAGSATRLEIEIVKEFVSLAGTHVNCAGGPTPWRSWLTCEETVLGVQSGFSKPHGYVFEVPVDAMNPAPAVPLRALGRFVHEAVAVDPRTNVIYLTEDRPYEPMTNQVGSGFYRFVGDRNAAPGDRGKLQALRIDGLPNYNTASGQAVGRTFLTRWVDIPDPDPPHAESDASAVLRQGLEGGAAIFDRLEGCWYARGSIYFNATSGGNAKAGQVWRYTPNSVADGFGFLTLIFESPSRDVLANPDNLCASPRGGLILCEDSGGIQHIRGLTQRGEIFPLVRTSGPSTEFCGACFSPSGTVLFFNTQGGTTHASLEQGATYALWGPWETGSL